MINIIYEDEFIIAINKPSGMISEKNPFESHTAEGEVMDYLSLSKKKPFLGVIHRLDKVTSGVIIFAKKKSALQAFNKLFELRTIVKTYHALTQKLPLKKEGDLENHLLKHQTEKQAFVQAKKSKDSKLAILHYKCLQSKLQPFLIELKPRTGRFHQIRVQLSHINCAIIGDLKYGSKQTYSGKGIALHAFSLAFTHPFLSKKKMLIKAPYPKQRVWQNL